ncbi:MAG: hypothetical protein ACE5Q6_19965 [Dehalococcoidia bacterium]
MSIAKETLQAMIRDFGGFELTDEELELVRPEVEAYQAAMEELRNLDLSNVFSSRLLRVSEGEVSDGGQ